MKIAVCVKQVPNRDYALSLTDDASWIREEGLAWEINEFDLFGIEAALQLKDRFGGEVLVVGVGPQRITDALRKALAMGADRAIRVDDPHIPITAPYAVATVLAAVLKKEATDLVITGVQSEDMAFFQTGPIIAQQLGYESAAMVVGIEPRDEQNFKVVLELEGGLNEEIEIRLPAVLTVQTGWNQPRYASLRGIMEAKKKPLDTQSLADLGLQPEDLRAPHGRMVWEKLEVPVQETHVEFLEGAPEEIAEQLFEKLAKEAKVL